MSIEYIRKTYKVPAKIGGKVRYTDTDGHKWDGVIKSAPYHYLNVDLDWPGNRRVILHPTWNIEYLDQNP